MGLDFSKTTTAAAPAATVYRTQKMRSLLWNSMTLLPTGKK
mgnify:CR=1 FL=1